MPKVSRKQLDKDIEIEILKQFYRSLSKINNDIEASQFLSDLLTPTEQLMLSKRLAIAILLIRGKSPTEIKSSIKVTYSTIGSVGSWIKNASLKTRRILLSFSKEKDWEAIIDKVEEILDKLPPRYGSDWKLSFKGKYRRTLARSTRKNLR